MRRSRGLWALGGIGWLVLMSGGCVSATFVATNGRSVPGPSRLARVYQDQLPPFPFDSVGLIDVKAPSFWPHADIVSQAAQKAGEVGCDFVIARKAFRDTGHGAGPAESAQPVSRQFVCGVALSPASSPPWRRPGSARIAVSGEVRAAPMVRAAVLMVLGIGQPVEIIGDTGNGWAATRLFDGRIGYLPFTALEFDVLR